MASALFPTMQRFVADEWIRLDSERITPWAFFNSHFGVICTDFETIDAANLRRAHERIESHTAKGKIVLEGY